MSNGATLRMIHTHDPSQHVLAYSRILGGSNQGTTPCSPEHVLSQERPQPQPAQRHAPPTHPAQQHHHVQAIPPPCTYMGQGQGAGVGQAQLSRSIEELAGAGEAAEGLQGMHLEPVLHSLGQGGVQQERMVSTRQRS